MTIHQINELLQGNQFDEALRALDAALAIEPQNGYLWNRRGNVIQLLDRSDGPPLSEVERSHLKALEINAKDLDAIEELAHYYDIENKPDLAKKYAVEYLRIAQKACAAMSVIIKEEA